VFSSFVLPLISPHNISCFGGIWERMTCALCVFLPLHWLHRFEFSSEICGSESSLSLLLLGSWNPRRLSGLVDLGDLQLSCGVLPKLYGASVAISWGPPIKLWRPSQALWCLSGDSLGASN
jgi:hypothetical protein